MSDLKKGEQGHTWSGKPAVSEEEELKRKGRNKWTMGEASGSEDHDDSKHPVAQETGIKGESNAGQDEVSGSEGVDPDPVPQK